MNFELNDIVQIKPTASLPNDCYDAAIIRISDNKAIPVTDYKGVFKIIEILSARSIRIAPISNTYGISMSSRDINDISFPCCPTVERGQTSKVSPNALVKASILKKETL